MPTAVPASDTVSPGTTPTSVPGVPESVAVVVPSYVLSFAVIPLMVSCFGVMLCDREPDTLPV